jgi:antitoxin (DNA-binding transcriptional repressor) of toxin-antitoxin stability system
MTETRSVKATRSGSRARPTISATDAAKTFGRLVDRVREERAVYVIERGGTPVAEIGPVAAASCTLADLVEVLRTRSPLDKAYLREVGSGVKAWNKPAVPRDRWTS